jgi:hypothetical protein
MRLNGKRINAYRRLENWFYISNPALFFNLARRNRQKILIAIIMPPNPPPRRINIVVNTQNFVARFVHDKCARRKMKRLFSLKIPFAI